MRVKTYQKVPEIHKKVPVLNENQQKATLFEHILYHSVEVGIQIYDLIFTIYYLSYWRCWVSDEESS
jgi:hypothetical protein